MSLHDILLAKALSGGGSGGGADWNAAEGEAGHVLHRTHYKERNTIIPATTLDFNEDNCGEVTYEMPCPFVAGKVYTVVYNGTPYHLTAVERFYEQTGTWVEIGSPGVVGDGIITDGPFNLSYQNDGNGDGLLWVSDISSYTEEWHTVTLEVYEEVVEKLPVEYLPEGMGYTEAAVLFPETQLQGANGQYAVPNFIPVDGETYTVAFNGTDYTVTAFSAGEVVGMGNFAAMGGTDTGEPFAIGYTVADNTTMCVVMDGSTAVVLKISEEVVHKIDAKFLTPSVYYVDIQKDGESYTTTETVENLTKVFNEGRFIVARIKEAFDGGFTYKMAHLHDAQFLGQVLMMAYFYTLDNSDSTAFTLLSMTGTGVYEVS